MNDDPEVILIYETLLASILKDFASMVSLIGAIWVGVWLDSQALQWIAGILWAVWFITAVSRAIKTNRYTITEARRRLDELEAQNG